MERNDDVIELGSVTAETHGIEGMIPDWAHGQDPARLSED